ncbi:Rec8 like protein-domain-containing protein [Cubamyces menziesii]|uniref:Cohesin subunit rad21 n=1 Tax=Trametes cubensis TaxID=1111947 RepID=A0AAD7U2A5_9APHY|nr:Rec8 like protein-domain-containing protein [Cubamyces menziesii]KAJ8496492.1 hypothetical protein ONZ51_g1116 [Trametes cubensis]
MFYSEAILSRRGPLAKVWLAAHMERKLSKTQTLQTDIEQSVDAIMHQEIEVMALRLSGQLLLGVVRIYSRKAKYLLDDCNEALLKIKMAFRPGIVDMTEDQLTVNQNAITLQSNNLDLDALLPDLDWDTADFEIRDVQPGGQHIARVADITLGTADLQFDFDDAGYGFDLGPSDGIGSQDYDIDLNLDFGDGPAAPEPATPRSEDDEMSVEVGRDAAPPRAFRESLDSHILGARGEADIDVMSARSRAQSENPFAADVDMGFGPDVGGMDVDLGLSFGDEPLSEHAPTPRLTPSRASSPLTEPPQTPPPDVELTPKAVAEEATKKKKEKRQIIDSVTELEDGPGAQVGRGRNGGLGAAMAKDVSDIVTEHPSLPRSSLVMRLLEIRDDPLAHFLPTKTTAQGTFFNAAPPGLVPELADMFMRPLTNLSAAKRRGASPEKPPSKKRRTEGSVAGEEEEVEQGRREGSRAPSLALGSDVYGRASLGPGMDITFGDQTGMGEDFQMDVPEFEGGPVGPERARSKSLAPSVLSRLSTPPPDIMLEEGDESHADVTCPIAIFDDRIEASQTQSQAMSQATTELASSDDGKGYSKNTVKALAIVRRELQPSAEEPAEEKYMSFNNMAQKASRRAAAAFFFELLVLGTRDCIKLSQPEPFANIEVRAKDRLWERQRHGSLPSTSSAAFPRASIISPPGLARRQGSAAPSIASAFGL